MTLWIDRLFPICFSSAAGGFVPIDRVCAGVRGNSFLHAGRGNLLSGFVPSREQDDRTEDARQENERRRDKAQP